MIGIAIDAGEIVERSSAVRQCDLCRRWLPAIESSASSSGVGGNLFWVENVWGGCESRGVGGITARGGWPSRPDADVDAERACESYGVLFPVFGSSGDPEPR
jgi:hypothetical protein